jgi:hypothetical protein
MPPSPGAGFVPGAILDLDGGRARYLRSGPATTMR